MAYNWWLFLHIAGAFGFVMAHGASVAVSFRMRKERDRQKIQDLKELSGSTLIISYVFFVMLLVGGIVAGFMAHWWSHWWIWAALGILIGMTVAMGVLARPYYEKVMQAVQARESGVPRASDEELAQLLRSPIPVINALIGFAGLVAIIWLMVFKPG